MSKSRLRRLRAEARARERMRPIAEGSSPSLGSKTDVERALLRLPRRQREVTVLRYYLGMDVREMAHTLGASEGTVKTQLFRARRALAALLGEEDDEEVEDAARLR
jgi:DNA-directed RNA polymerase specialized sigma24 family protein